MKQEALCPTCRAHGIFYGCTGIRYSCLSLQDTRKGTRTQCEHYIRKEDK